MLEFNSTNWPFWLVNNELQVSINGLDVVSVLNKIHVQLETIKHGFSNIPAAAPATVVQQIVAPPLTAEEKAPEPVPVIPNSNNEELTNIIALVNTMGKKIQVCEAAQLSVPSQFAAMEGRLALLEKEKEDRRKSENNMLEQLENLKVVVQVQKAELTNLLDEKSDRSMEGVFKEQIEDLRSQANDEHINVNNIMEKVDVLEKESQASLEKMQTIFDYQFAEQVKVLEEHCALNTHESYVAPVVEAAAPVVESADTSALQAALEAVEHRVNRLVDTQSVVEYRMVTLDNDYSKLIGTVGEMQKNVTDSSAAVQSFEPKLNHLEVKKANCEDLEQKADTITVLEKADNSEVIRISEVCDNVVKKLENQRTVLHACINNLNTDVEKRFEHIILWCSSHMKAAAIARGEDTTDVGCTRCLVCNHVVQSVDKHTPFSLQSTKATMSGVNNQLHRPHSANATGRHSRQNTLQAPLSPNTLRSPGNPNQTTRTNVSSPINAPPESLQDFLTTDDDGIPRPALQPSKLTRLLAPTDSQIEEASPTKGPEIVASVSGNTTHPLAHGPNAGATVLLNQTDPHVMDTVPAGYVLEREYVPATINTMQTRPQHSQQPGLPSVASSPQVATSTPTPFTFDVKVQGTGSPQTMHNTSGRSHLSKGGMVENVREATALASNSRTKRPLTSGGAKGRSGAGTLTDSSHDIPLTSLIGGNNGRLQRGLSLSHGAPSGSASVPSLVRGGGGPKEQ